ncbi:MAG: hypothetical protein RI912_62 [Actinomycetota bacterium]|jgi:thiamine pyrophosphokinase
MGTQHAIIYTGGDSPHAGTRPHITADAAAGALVIAADSGWEHAVSHGTVPSVLVGDMDSISEHHLRDARAHGAEIVEHPRDKDETDAEIALALAARRGAGRITVVSGGGDRPDHVFALLHSLASPSLSGISIDGWLGRARFAVLRAGDAADLPAAAGNTVSLLPVAGDATVTATGLAWPLERSVLVATSSRGISNVATGTPHVTVHGGSLIAFITGDETERDTQ